MSNSKKHISVYHNWLEWHGEQVTDEDDASDVRETLYDHEGKETKQPLNVPKFGQAPKICLYCGKHHERFDYSIVSVIFDAEQLHDYRENYEALIRYLNTLINSLNT